MDDSKIVELFFDRSELAISETSKKYGRYCHYIAYNILRNNEDAEECVNDTYMRAWNSIPPKRPNKLQTYLGKITRNLALNMLEKLTAQKRGKGQIPLVLDELGECIPDERSSTDIVEDMYIKELLDRFLDALPAETRKIFVRRYWYMSAVKEIAREYNLTESKVTVTLFRTRKKLKEYLEEEGIHL
jgi:RNA polymerase sigma-70 factor (ECF subfamily)